MRLRSLSFQEQSIFELCCFLPILSELVGLMALNPSIFFASWISWAFSMAFLSSFLTIAYTCWNLCFESSYWTSASLFLSSKFSSSLFSPSFRFCFDFFFKNASSYFLRSTSVSFSLSRLAWSINFLNSRKYLGPYCITWNILNQYWLNLLGSEIKLYSSSLKLRVPNSRSIAIISLNKSVLATFLYCLLYPLVNCLICYSIRRLRASCDDLRSINNWRYFMSGLISLLVFSSLCFTNW